MTHYSSEDSDDDLWEKVVRECHTGNFQSVMPLLRKCQNGEIQKNHHWLGGLLEVAIDNGKEEVVEFLANKLQVNIHHDGFNSRFDYGNALIEAIRGNNMVEDLIKIGADVNVVRGGTPLIEACTSENLNVVKQLLDKGASVNLTTLTGFSPLMAASCIRGDIGVRIMTCLLEHGADCNLQNDAGRNALHMAVMYGNAETVQKLLERQAEVLKDANGFTPLFLAVDCEMDDIFDLFQSSQFVAKTDKVNALEHKAASLAPDDMEGVYEFLHKAMEARYEDPSNILDKPVREPVAAFGNVCESRTLEELDARRSMNYVLLMECLAVENRLLGSNICLTENFDKILRKLLDAGLYNRALSLTEYGMQFLYLGTAQHIFMDVLQLSRKTSQTATNYILSLTEKAMQCAIKMLKSVLEICGNFMKPHYVMASSCLKLLSACMQLDIMDGKPRAQIQAKYMIDSFLPLNYEYPIPLYAATCLVLDETTDFDFSLYKSLVSFLVKCGANINEKNQREKTILAHVLQATVSAEDQKAIVQFLLEEGASPAYLRKDAGFPSDCTNDVNILQLLRPHYPLPLSHLAAFAIINNGIQYESRVPEKVAKFIDGLK